MLWFACVSARAATLPTKPVACIVCAACVAESDPLTNTEAWEMPNSWSEHCPTATKSVSGATCDSCVLASAPVSLTMPAATSAFAACEITASPLTETAAAAERLLEG
jgi:hypothetical protein